MKNNNKLGNAVKIIGVAITLLVIFAGLIVNWTMLFATQETQDEKILTIQTKGSDLAAENEKAIIEIKTDLRYIKEGIDDIKVELQQK